MSVLVLLARLQDRLATAPDITRSPAVTARMLETMSDRSKVVIRAFREKADAEEWLLNPVRYDPITVHFPARNTVGTGPDAN